MRMKEGTKWYYMHLNQCVSAVYRVFQNRNPESKLRQ